jgi:hypothetical protein
MADFTINDVNVKTIDPVRKNLTLTAGQKISDDADILDMATKLVPAGYEVDVRVKIIVTSVRTV